MATTGEEEEVVVERVEEGGEEEEVEGGVEEVDFSFKGLRNITKKVGKKVKRSTVSLLRRSRKGRRST